MKWIYIIIICLLYSCSNKQELYEEKMNDLQFKLEFGRYNMWIDNFKEIEDRFPNTLNEFYLAYKAEYKHLKEIELLREMKFLEEQYLIDVFSKKREWVGYFPIYNSDDSQIISYLILSAGIDGKLDNVNDPANKLHLDDWKQKLNLYNPDEFDDGVNIFFDDFNERMRPFREAHIKERPYNAREEKSGNKDLLIYVHHLVRIPSRAFGDAFLLHYGFQGINSVLLTKDRSYFNLWTNYFETQAYDYHWW